MKPTNEVARCSNCEVACQVIVSVSAIFGDPLWYLNCGECGSFWYSEDKLHWHLLQQIKLEKVVKGG